MGKTAQGAVWLAPDRTSCYEYYQYWINTDDRDVARFLALFTFLPMSEIRKVETLSGVELNSAKQVLAFETTRLAHGKEEAMQAYQASASMFGARVVPEEIIPSSTIPRQAWDSDDASVPRSYIKMDQLKAGVPAFKIFHQVGLAGSRGAARRLIEQGGAYVNDQRIASFDQLITENDIKDMEILLRSGKKRYHKIKIK
jgi:tyrosyl-tRNA synthetase